jgi:hypothetical protein
MVADSSIPKTRFESGFAKVISMLILIDLKFVEKIIQCKNTS